MLETSTRTLAVSVVCFAYNEEGALERTVREALSALAAGGTDFEIVIVDDGSTDRTGAMADDLAAADERVVSLHHERNRGIGAALRTGFAAARGRTVAPLPADGQIAPTDILTLLAAKADADIAVGTYSRLPDGLLRAVLSAGLSAATRLVAGEWPAGHGFYVADRDLVLRLAPRSDTFFFNVELVVLARRAGARVVEIDITPRRRFSGSSKVLSARRIASVALDLLSLGTRRA